MRRQVRDRGVAPASPATSARASSAASRATRITTASGISMSDASAAVRTACTASCAARAATRVRPGAAQRVVDAHHGFPGRDLVGDGLVVLVDRARDGADVVAVEPAAARRRTPSSSTAWVNGAPAPETERILGVPPGVSRRPGSGPARRGCRPPRPGARRSPASRRIVTRTITPPTITSTRPGSSPGLWRRCVERLGREGAEHVLDRGLGQAEWWIRSRSYSGEPELDRGHRRHRAREPDERLARPSTPGTSRIDVGDVLAHDVHRLAQLLGRGRIGVQPRLGEPHAADVDRQHALGLGRCRRRTRSSRRRCRRRGTARLARVVEPRRRAEERERGLLLAGEQLGLGRRGSRPRARRSRRGSSRRAPRSSRSRAPRSTPPSSSITVAVLAQRRERPLDRFGREPARSRRRPGPSRVIVIRRSSVHERARRGRSTRRRAGGSSWCRCRSPRLSSARSSARGRCAPRPSGRPGRRRRRGTRRSGRAGTSRPGGCRRRRRTGAARSSPPASAAFALARVRARGPRRAPRDRPSASAARTPPSASSRDTARDQSGATSQ